MNNLFIENIVKKIKDGYSLSKEEAMKLINLDHNNEEDMKILCNGANEIRKYFVGDNADLCTIMNAKSGKCSEDCKYCAQSAHYKVGVDEYELVHYDSILARALEVQKSGAHRFSLVTSGKGITDDKEMSKLIDIYSKLKKDTNLKLCASHGIITYDFAVKLKEAGVSMYHHNIETSKRYYKEICHTHTYADRIKTIENVKKAGLDICCGGIIGMGETNEDRIDMIFEIKKMGLKSVPVNVLKPVKGTPFEENIILEPNEILKIMAVFRYIIPEGYIRYAGGRMALKDRQQDGFHSGVNAALVGNYLTTIGSDVENDKKMIKEAGMRY